ncbi:(d)CMP kinase [Alteriqipengyuania lutimaris]|uniref:Cytidylate kinase n=1 Tax=Alteriqipengyuania lutimaris TaxID=1538146 RepID=A0A395LGT6_9SPHN|nr:d(CMP) kinase [Alteriqipengyuania lutimaris]MBB3035189.1 cytidylate kinase [Alteriqipengyuania lutimaris]RDS75799.1 (d)CMP kinase [Alteriqipengyuania lutimaris]
MIIAVDGPTASGKGTIASAIARHFGLPHLDTGLLYRAVGRQVQLAGGDPDNAEHALAGASFPDSLLDDPELRSEDIGGFASRVSVHHDVRTALLDRQRLFAQAECGAVLDGRDIGTVICPDADVKLFVTASLDARTERRFAEMQGQGRDMTRNEVYAQIERRDARDMGRKDAPLKPASDAFILDTTSLDKQASIEAAIAAVEDVRGQRG